MTPFIWRIVRYGGIRGALFGASIERAISEVKGSKLSISARELAELLRQAAAAHPTLTAAPT